MTVPQFSRPGAVDLSALRKPAAAARGAASSAAGSFAFDVTSEESLRVDVVERSMSVVVFVSFWSQQAPASVEINDTLTRLAEQFAGRFLVARVDVGANPQLAQLLGVARVPLVVAALRGQLAPLVQEALPEAEMRAMVEQILEAAAANGVTGTAEPVAGTPADAEAREQPAEPESRYVEAEAALLSGNLDVAIGAYEQALRTSPGDPEASVGLARAQLLKRTQGVDPATARQRAAARPDDVSAQIMAADLALLNGHVDDAFSRLVELVRRTSDGDRDTARRHLIEMFSVVGDDDPRVAKARQSLASALF